MNTEAIKSELQQVLDNDIQLRREFNALKRSLSDYRNQLIMRDEDCKRLQVTIDVLNTKLVVLERDNNSYKTELNSFRELRGTIREQLDEKQAEIEARLNEIHSLREEITTMAAGYEAQIAGLRSESEVEIARLRSEQESTVAELKTSSQYREKGMREEHENLLSSLSSQWADKEQMLSLRHEDEIAAIRQLHSEELLALQTSYEEKLALSTQLGSQETEALRAEYEQASSQREEELNQKIASLENVYQAEIDSLRAALEEQGETLTSNLTAEIDRLSSELSAQENKLTEQYNERISNLEQDHQKNLNDTISSYEERINSIITEYEEKLSNTLIHSNSQNSKLNEELGKAREENESLHTRASELNADLNLRSVELADLSLKLSATEEQLKAEVQKYETLGGEFQNYKDQTILSESEVVQGLHQQIAALNHSHSDYVNELNTRIEDLSNELKNLGVLFENNTNLLSEAESRTEKSNSELQQALQQIENLNAELARFTELEKEHQMQLEQAQTTWNADLQNELKEKNLEFEKLLAENTNLIEEIDSAQDKVEAQEHELSILKGELEEVRMQSIGKSQYFKETLSNKNFEITNLEANNAALQQEINNLKKEIAQLSQDLKARSDDELNLEKLRTEHLATTAKLQEMQAEIDTLYTIITNLNDKVAGYEDKIGQYEEQLKLAGNTQSDAEREAFIDRLFKQIDELNDQKLSLLNEKESMATQLLKMNEVVGSLSQQVESEQIDTGALNNHRRNIILATNSEGPNNSPMKEQINDLVREIDKCIALLSA